MARAAVEHQPNLAISLTGGVRERTRFVPGLARLGPGLLLTVPVLFNLWTLRAETSPVQNLNDSHLHFAMIRWVRAQILHGNLLPLDNWFPYLGMGSAQLRHYSDFGHLLAGYVSVVAGAATTYDWSLYLLLALWPVSVYFGARLFEWNRWTAAAAALCSPLLVSAMNYGYERGSYTWYGFGLWAQLWGMWLLPIALGLTWRAVRGKGSYWLAALAVSLTIASHYMEGYVALLAIGLWVLLTPSELLPRLVRAIGLGLASLLAAAWALVPLLQDGRFNLNSEYDRGSFFRVSFGAPKVLGWLVTGQLYDAGRSIPIVSLLVGVGLLVCLMRFRRDEQARAVVLLWLTCLVLFFGPATFGNLLSFLPGDRFLAYHRFIMGVHLAGLLLAGVGAVWLGQKLIALSRRLVRAIRPALAAAAAAVLLVLSLYPAWAQIATQDNTGRVNRSTQQLWDATDGADLQVLIDFVKTLSPGRVYAGPRWGWGQYYTVGWVPVYAFLANEDVDAIGFKLRVSSLMSDAEMVFDDSNRADYELFGIRYLFLPADRSPSVAATLLAQQGRHTLWQVATSGYFDVVDTTWPPLVEDNGTIATHALGFVDSTDLAQHRYPAVAFGASGAGAPSLQPGVVPQGPAGQVVNQQVSLIDGTFKADIVANRTSAILFKSSYDPRWRVSVDGVQLRPDMVAPALMARTLPAGRHSVVFHYLPDPEHPLLLGIGFLALLGLALAPRLKGNLRPRLRRLSPPPLAEPRSAGSRDFPRGQGQGGGLAGTDNLRRQLEYALRDVEGFFLLDEAWALHEAARLFPPITESVTVMEIGSWKGRSTIALALGVKERGNGTVHAIDPHTGSRELIELYGPVDTFGSFLSNIERAGLSDVVIPVRKTSHHARMMVEDRSVHVLFVDGSHEYVDVAQDIDDWVTAVADRAVVIFNDPSSPGVYRALRERVVVVGSPFRSPRLIQNSLFFTFNRQATDRDWFAWIRLRAVLGLRYQAERIRPHLPVWLVRFGSLSLRRMVGG